uniref:Flagellar export chaperone FliS n=1 Tax=Heterorhabditis bacteriophora TaxID=37862 RepID=A0A1I7X5R9_HETBA
MSAVLTQSSTPENYVQRYQSSHQLFNALLKRLLFEEMNRCKVNGFD